MVQNVDFTLRIQNWYKDAARVLPWRETKSAYCIWLSEIILQQTRVQQGFAYYVKFLKLFPTVKDLAQASEQEVLTAWQGLGYYSRARNMHKAAKQIYSLHKGNFPSDYPSILKLPGIGEYTAAAIASFAFNEKYAVVDGNVFRVLSRYFNSPLAIDNNEGKKYFATIAQEILDKNNPAQHNQAIMELGALVCTPRNAKCNECPLSETCEGRAKNTLYALPVKSKKTSVSMRYLHFLLIENEEEILIEKRTNKGIWQNLYQLPLIELTEKQSLEQQNIPNIDIKNIHFIESYKHLLTHQVINAYFYRVAWKKNIQFPQNWIKIKKAELSSFPIPRLIDKFLTTHLSLG
jgi:A/G-specific adenine glycosylase